MQASLKPCQVVERLGRSLVASQCCSAMKRLVYTSPSGMSGSQKCLPYTTQVHSCMQACSNPWSADQAGVLWVAAQCCCHHKRHCAYCNLQPTTGIAHFYWASLCMQASSNPRQVGGRSADQAGLLWLAAQCCRHYKGRRLHLWLVQVWTARSWHLRVSLESLDFAC